MSTAPPAPASSPARTLLARRPILGLDAKVHAHEHLVADPVALALDPSAELLVPTPGAAPAWLAAPRELLEIDPLPFLPGTVVLHVAPTQAIDGALVARLRRLRTEGHLVALADVLARRDQPPVAAIADFVTVDLTAHGAAGIRAVRRRLGGTCPKLVAVGVETQEQYDTCVQLEVDLVQGFFFERPRSGAAAAPVGAATIDRLRSVIELRERPGFEQVEAVVATDPGLTVRLLRLANSAAISAGRRLGSVHEAMVVLGSEPVRQFALMVLADEVGHARPALVAAAVLRGRLCETLVLDQASDADPDLAFTAGVLSVVDALLDRPMVQALAMLPLSDELHWALLGQSGPVGVALGQAIRIERGRDQGPRPFPGLRDVVARADATLDGLSA